MATAPDSTGPTDDEARRIAVDQALRTWAERLVDLGGRNTLLHHRDLKQGTLDLSPGAVAQPALLDDLLAGRTVRLSRLVGAEALPAAARRARTIVARATEHLEERGLATLQLAWGFATWTSTRGTATPNAPVLLCALDLRARAAGAEDFDLALVGEWEVNPTLLHLLRVDHGVVVDGDELVEPPDVAASALEDPADPAADGEGVFERLLAAAADVPGFGITGRMVAGTYAYAKQPMVDDLLDAHDLAEAHPVVSALAGSRADLAHVRARQPDVPADLPDRLDPAREFLVLDADASQSWVVQTVLAGGDVVVQGPPGTGKSQTIANLLAALAAAGRTVLFVAEKRAAIDAVVDRLRRVGLGDVVLDLHGGGGRRRQLAADLATALEHLGQVPAGDRAGPDAVLQQRRDLLNAADDALHRRHAPWDLSMFEVQARLLVLPPTVRSARRVRGLALQALDDAAARGARDAAEAWVDLGGPAAVDPATPWSVGVGAVHSAEDATGALTTVHALATDVLPAGLGRLVEAAASCGLRVPQTVLGWAALADLLERVAATLGAYGPDVFDADLPGLVRELAPAAQGRRARLVATALDGGYRRARRAAAALAATPQEPAALHAGLAEALAVRTAWTAARHDDGGPRLPPDLPGVVQAQRTLAAQLGRLGTWTGGTDLAAVPTDDVVGRVHALLADQATLVKLPRLQELADALERAGLGGALGEVVGRGLDAPHAAALVEHVWLASVHEQLLLHDPVLAGLEGAARSRAAQDFRAHDAAHVAAGAARVRRAVAEAAVQALDDHPDEATLVAAEVRKKRRHRPVRELVALAPNVLTALKPCWVMSPLVVAQLLPARGLHFDVVVFDEASQIPPEDAISALLRGRQVVVAGDRHQLPPTTFFAAGDEPDDDGPPLVAGQAPRLTTDMQSILDAMGSALASPRSSRTLQWHYRSRDERLIAFSNAQPSLYDGALTTFPGVGGGQVLRHVLVPWRPSDAAAAGSDGTESTADEVARVVELVAEHARERPAESLGVIAMGIVHAARISEAVRRASALDPVLDGFLRAHPAERFFVKNLERVQGDERDAIVLSVGYAKGADGRLAHRFGPLNVEGGERRLNVAVTRARGRMVVVSSFASGDLDPARLGAEGAAMLRRYLAYAESGGSDLGAASPGPAVLDPFEEDLREHLAAAGLPVQARLGVGGSWIDLVVAHPHRPGTWVLAIEHDGPAYHARTTARDRDRLRQDHLERLGWRVHRIWSGDWVRGRAGEVARAVAAWEDAVALYDRAEQDRAERTAAAALPDVAPVPTAAPVPSPPLPTRGPRPPVATGLPIGGHPHADLVALVRWIESDTLLRTEDELLAEAMVELGFRRRGPRIVAALQAAIATARTPA